MKIYKEVKQPKLDDISCDICGESCKKPLNIESAHLSANWSYDSKQDGDVYSIDFCEKCFNKVIGYLESIAKNTNTLKPSNWIK